MNEAPSNEVLQRRANIGLIAVFLILLWMPTADTILGIDHAAVTDENRVLAEFPKFKFHLSLRRNGELLARYQQYFNDHFGFRRLLVLFEHDWKWALFHDMHSDLAIGGKSGWLFCSDRRMVYDLQGVQPFTDIELANWQALITGRRDWLRDRGIKYLFVVSPDKHSIYSEFLPDWLVSSIHPPRRVDQFIAYMKAHSDLPILDLREALLEVKPSGRVYKKTDTHWNDRGAFAAYQRIMKALATAGVPGPALDLTDMEESLTDDPGGDLTLQLRQQSRMPETANPYLVPRMSGPTPEYRSEHSELDPDRRLLVSLNVARSGKAVVFHDSFMNALVPFLGQSYQRIVFVWQQNWDKVVIEREKPDIVVDEILERFLIWRDPLDLKMADEQPHLHVRDVTLLEK